MFFYRVYFKGGYIDVLACTTRAARVKAIHYAPEMGNPTRVTLRP